MEFLHFPIDGNQYLQRERVLVIDISLSTRMMVMVSFIRGNVHTAIDFIVIRTFRTCTCFCKRRKPDQDYYGISQVLCDYGFLISCEKLYEKNQEN